MSWRRRSFLPSGGSRPWLGHLSIGVNYKGENYIFSRRYIPIEGHYGGTVEWRKVDRSSADSTKNSVSKMSRGVIYASR